MIGQLAQPRAYGICGFECACWRIKFTDRRKLFSFEGQIEIIKIGPKPCENSLAEGLSTSEGYSEIAKRREILARRTARRAPIFWSAHMWRSSMSYDSRPKGFIAGARTYAFQLSRGEYG
jgi:hypothetical protein